MEGCAEINCSVIGGVGLEPRSSVCEQPVAAEEYHSFQDKYLRGGKSSKESAGMVSLQRRIPAPISEALSKEVQDNALKAFRAIDASGVARIDSFVTEDTGETWVMEINAVPGSFSFYLWEATGMPFDELLSLLIASALAAHKAKSELLFSFDSTMLGSLPTGKAGG